MNPQEIKVNICLSKRFQLGAYEILQTAFTNNREAGLIAHKFDLGLFRRNCQKYMQDDTLRNHLNQTLNIQSAQELESYVDNISKSTNDIENNSNYLQLEQALHDYLYAPEEGKQLLLEYQSTIASGEKLGNEFKVPFNDFLRDKLINIRSFDELKPYPMLYHHVKTHGAYKNVQALASALKNVNVIANIHHAPQELTDGTGLVLNEFDSTRLLNFRSYDTGWDNVSEIKKDMDYNPGSAEDRAELFNNGNFCGSIFQNIKFECDLDGIKFQNCTLKNVLFAGNSLNNIDFRGAKLQSTAFDIQDNINDIKLDVNDLGTLERVGIAKFDLSQRSLDTELEIDDSVDTNETIVDNIRQYIGRFEDLKQRANDVLQSNEQGGWNFFGWSGSIINNTLSAVTQLMPTNLLQNDLSEEQLRISVSNLKKEMDSTIENIRQKNGQMSQDYIDLSNEYNQLIVEYEGIKRNHRYQANLNELPVQATNITTDSTYRPSEEGKNIVKIDIKANRADMEEFVTSNETNLSKFIQNKYSAKVNDITRQRQQAHELNDTETIMIIPDVSGEDLSGINFHRKDMSSTILARCDLSQCNFSNTILAGTCFEEANVTNAIFHDATLLDANMMLVSGGGVQFDNANLTNIKFIGASIGARALDGNERVPSSFKNAILSDIDMREGDLNSCNFSDAKVQKSDFSYSNMIYVDAKDTEMKTSTFDQVNGYRSNFANSKLNASSMQEATMAYTNFSRSELVDADLNRLDARGATFQVANMRGVNAQNSDLTQANLNAVNAQNADFASANLTGVQATNANFSSAKMLGTNANKAIFVDADLSNLDAREAMFQSSNMQGVNAQNSNFTQANLNAANAQNANFSDANLTKSQAIRADFSNTHLQSAKLTDGSFISSKFCSANMSTCDINNSDMFNADFTNANMRQVLWNKDTKTFGTNIESAQNVPPELVQHHKDEQNITSPIKLMFNSVWNKILNFANIDVIQNSIYTAVLSVIVALSLPVILATSVAAFIVPPVGIVFTVIGAVALTVSNAQQIIYYSAVTNPIEKVINQFTKVKNKIFSYNSSLAKNSTDINKSNDTLSNTIPSQTITTPKAQSHNTSKLQSNTETTVQNNDIDNAKLKNKITRADSKKLSRRSSTANKANHSIIKKNVADDTSKVTTNDINNNHTKNQQQNKNDQLNQLLTDNPNVKKLQANVKLDERKNKAPQSSAQIVSKKDFSSRTP